MQSMNATRETNQVRDIHGAGGTARRFAFDWRDAAIALLLFVVLIMGGIIWQQREFHEGYRDEMRRLWQAAPR